MKKFAGILLLICLIFVGCPIVTQNDNSIMPTNSANSVISVIPGPVDSAFWFIEIHEKLIERAGGILSDSYPNITDSSGIDMAQMVNCEYVCNAINATWGTSFAPVAGTATQAANCEYLLKMIDMANDDRTSYGTGSYATKQVLDKTAVDTAVNTLWIPGGKFVAIANSGNIAAYSTNGINWTAASMPSTGNWSNVTYGNGKFVAVDNSRAAYSTDGINWEPATTLPNNQHWRDVTYGDGRFVAVGNGNAAAYSTDGINWTAALIMGVSAPYSGNWSNITYGNGKFVAVSGSGYNAVVYSANGTNWTAATLPYNGNWSNITYGNGKFVAIGHSNIAAYSTDGINWATATTLPNNQHWRDVAYGNGRFVVVSSSDRAAYSTDGVNWTGATMPNTIDWLGVIYGNGEFVAIACNSNIAAYSTNGINWTASMLSTGNWSDITYGGN
jgi:hypothetical protein